MIQFPGRWHPFYITLGEPTLLGSHRAGVLILAEWYNNLLALARLVCFGPSNSKGQSFRHKRYILNILRDQFRLPDGTRKTHKQQSTVPDPNNVIVARCHHAGDGVSRGGRLLSLWRIAFMVSDT